MIKYRPHRGLLEESMAEAMEFDTVDDMYGYIVSNSGGKLFGKEDLCISENLGADKRIRWAETRYVCTKRMGEQIYKSPQCIGMCSLV